jgi:sialic acid synthase SpsE
MKYLKEKFNIEIGYSDHCLGIQVALIAVAAGAKMIEKHFTTNKVFSNYERIK